jgi:hypothetical protein
MSVVQGVCDFGFCHGTTLNTLYMASKLPGDYQHSIVPYGELEQLKIPCFSGECLRGIQDTGVNRTYTSWVQIADANAAIRYSQSFHFDVEERREFLEAIISDYKKRIAKDPDCQLVPYAREPGSYIWNRITLYVRQVRAWDDAVFQEKLAPGLRQWIAFVIDHFGKIPFRPEKLKEGLDRIKAVQQELDGKPHFQLTAEVKTTFHKKNHPIVLLTSAKAGHYVSSGSGYAEFGFTTKTLGQDICCIATDEASMQDVNAHLTLYGLANKVTIISFRELQSIAQRIC